MSIKEEVVEAVDLLERELRMGTLQSITTELLEERYDDKDLRKMIQAEILERGISIVSTGFNSNKITPLEEMKLCSIYKSGTVAENTLKEIEASNSTGEFSLDIIRKLQDLSNAKQKAYATLEKKYYFLILKIVRAFHPKNKSEEDDFFQAARTGFVNALNIVDFTTHENTLSTFVYSQMQSEVQNQKERYCASVPTSHTIVRAKTAYFKYKAEHGGVIDDFVDLGEKLGYCMKTDKDVIQMKARVAVFENNSSDAVSLHTKVNNADEKECELMERIEETEETPLERRIKKEQCEALEDAIKAILTKEEFLVYMLKVKLSKKYDEIVDYLNEQKVYVAFEKKSEYDKNSVSNLYQKAKRKVDANREKIKVSSEEYLKTKATK